MFNHRQELAESYATVQEFEEDAHFETTLKELLMTFIQKKVKEKKLDHSLIPATITSDIITDVKASIATM